MYPTEPSNEGRLLVDFASLRAKPVADRLQSDWKWCIIRAYFRSPKTLKLLSRVTLIMVFFFFLQADISALNFDLTVDCRYFHRPLILRNSDLWSLLHVSSRYICNILLKDEDIGLLECDAGRWVKVS